MKPIEVPNISLTIGAFAGVDRLAHSSCPTKVAQVARAVTVCITPILALCDLMLNAALVALSFVGSKLHLTDGPEKHIDLLKALIFELPTEWIPMLKASFQQLATS